MAQNTLVVRVLARTPACPQQAQPHRRQRTQRVDKQVAPVQDVGQLALRQRIEQQRRQRQVDDELAQHAHVGAREKAPAGEEIAQRDGEVDRAGDGQDIEHVVKKLTGQHGAGCGPGIRG
jgi:hypothetical protein